MPKTIKQPTYPIISDDELEEEIGDINEEYLYDDDEEEIEWG
jgi:hypothetical protein